MTAAFLISLMRETVTAPRSAAERAIALGLPTRALWMVLALISVSLSGLVSGVIHFAEMPPEAQEALRATLFYKSPFLFALINWGNAVLSVLVLLWSGRMLGGTASLAEVLAVTVLFQATTVVLVLGMGLISMVLPVLSLLLFLALAVWVIWAMVSIIDVAHRFDNLVKAGGTFLIATFVVPFCLSIIIGVLSAPFIGVS